MPTRPEYSSLAMQSAADATYDANGDAWDATVTKVAPSLATIRQGLLRPRRQIPAQFRNWLDHEVATILAALADHVTTVQDVDVPAEAAARVAGDAALDALVGQLPALNFSEGVTSFGGNANAAAYDHAGRRWLLACDGGNVRGSKSNGWTWDGASLISGVAAGENVKTIAVDPSGNWVAGASGSFVFTFNASTSAYAKVAVGFNQAEVAYSTTAGRWCILVADALNAAAKTSTDRATWTAATLPPEWADFSTYPMFGDLPRMRANATSGRLVVVGVGGTGLGPSGVGSCRVMTSDDGGVTWTDRGTFAHGVVSPTEAGLCHNPDSGEWLYTIGETSGTCSGEVWRSADDGVTWSKVATLTTAAVLQPAPFRGSGWVALARTGTTNRGEIVYSLDAGATWRYGDFNTDTTSAKGAFGGNGGVLAVASGTVWPGDRASRPGAVVA